MNPQPAAAEVNHESAGRLTRIAGPVVVAAGLEYARLHDVVRVGHQGLIGEIIRLSTTGATIQVYEDTVGLRIGEPVISAGAPLVAHLGPGLLGSTYDGLQRPLTAAGGAFLQRGAQGDPLPLQKRWAFTPLVKIGAVLTDNQPLGHVAETPHLDHKILVPPGGGGRLLDIQAGHFALDDPVAVIENGRGQISISMRQRWPVRIRRPGGQRVTPNVPLLTGTRIIDAFFPLAKGGTAIIPGGFGTGKTVAEQALARWADADVVVYVGCGERGNEMAEVLDEFPQLEDPRFGAPLMSRTVLIANTSNMPVAAREASVYLGITIAEYYRDMGYDVLLLADSTSRWGEAMREISSRLEEMPGEEGYPAYLAARLAEFYERAGRQAVFYNPTDPPERAHGSVTIVGAVSPPGGDFSEPMTQNSLRVVGAFWALDYDLSRRRHYPAINWLNSYTLYRLQPWFAKHVAPSWADTIRRAMTILQQEEELLEIVELIGPDALAPEQQTLLLVAQMLREDFLQQSAFDKVDRHCSLDKSLAMLNVILRFEVLANAALQKGLTFEGLMGLEIIEAIARMKEIPSEAAAGRLQRLLTAVETAFEPWLEGR